MPNNAELVELFYRYVDHDAGLIEKILVRNPARLHGFPAQTGPFADSLTLNNIVLGRIERDDFLFWARYVFV